MTEPRAEYERRLAHWRERIAKLDRVNLHLSHGRLVLGVTGAILLWMAFVRASTSETFNSTPPRAQGIGCLQADTGSITVKQLPCATVESICNLPLCCKIMP